MTDLKLKLTLATSSQRLSVPARVSAPPRQLTTDEWSSFVAVTEALIPPDAGATGAIEDLRHWASTALAARAEHFDHVVEGLAEVGDLRGGEALVVLRAMAQKSPERFEVLSAVVAGAYLMVPEVRDRVGYPGQGRNVPRLEEALEQLEDGILDPVVNRGRLWVDPEGVAPVSADVEPSSSAGRSTARDQP